MWIALGRILIIYMLVRARVGQTERQEGARARPSPRRTRVARVKRYHTPRHPNTREVTETCRSDPKCTEPDPVQKRSEVSQFDVSWVHFWHTHHSAGRSTDEVFRNGSTCILIRAPKIALTRMDNIQFIFFGTNMMNRRLVIFFRVAWS